MPDVPTGALTFLFTDIESSTHLWERFPTAMPAALERHDSLLRERIGAHGGRVFKAMGDAFYAVFTDTAAALAAALGIQHGLAGPVAPGEPAIRVRAALHTGAAHERDGDYFGPSVNRVSRLLAAGHGGQTLLTQAARERVEGRLPAGTGLRDLGSHRLKDLQQPERIYQLLHPDLPAEFPPLRSLEAFAHNLPIQLTSFIGRRQEMETVRRLLEECRLLTLTGAGGCGKTRLALQVAAELVTEMPDGVWLVELGALTDPALVAPTVAAGLGLRESAEPRAIEERLAEFLQHRRLLLVLDNCEHLVAACAIFADSLLRACPGLRILCTTREPLGIAGEVAWRVPSLTQPDPRLLENGGSDPVSEIAEYEAVRLFIERAMAVSPGFQITPATAPCVAQVCRRLDGIPLAIELAAARVRVLSLEQIAAGLDDSCRLLTGGSRTALHRHQTLRATMDWSYNLLTEPERTLLRRLSVFLGGWTLEAVEAVCAFGAAPRSTLHPPALGPCQLGARSLELGADVLDLLTGLVDKSLVAVEELPGEAMGDGRSEAPRYRLLETIRQYSRDRLFESGEASDLRQRHFDWFLALAEHAEPELDGPRQRQWLDRLEREHENLRAALQWAEESHQAESGLQLGRKLWQFWWVRGYLAEGRDRLASLLAGAEPSARTAARAKALHGAGILAQDQGDYRAARALHEESLAIKRELCDRAGVAASLNNLGHVARLQGDYRAARALYEEGLAIGRELGDPRGLAFSLRGLGLIARYQGDLIAARAYYEESLAIARRLGDERAVAISLNNLALVALDSGDPEAARVYYQESLTIKQELGDRRGIAFALNGLGLTALYRGEDEPARRYFVDSLAIRRELGDRRGTAFSLHGLGTLALRTGDYAGARALYEESLAIRRELGDSHGIARSLLDLSEVARKEGAIPRAIELCAGSLLLFRDLGDRPGLAAALEERAALHHLAAEGDPAEAARLLGRAAALRSATGCPQPPPLIAEHLALLAELRGALGEEALAAAWEEGRAAAEGEFVVS
jgi:predicted ATPase/class 3 adenylate cyclase